MIEEYKKKEVLSLIKHEPYKSYFFRKAKNPEWLNILFQEGFLSPDQFPSPQENQKQKGYFSFPHWSALDYLERVSEQLKNSNEKDKYTKLLLKIIEDTTKYHIKNNKKLDNFRIWASFTKILSNIPNEKIEKEKLEFFIKTWLDSNFDVGMQFIEIGEKLLPKFLNSNNDEDIKKAEIIIKHLTQIKWYSKYSEKQRKEFEENKELSGLFDLEKESPKLLASEYWFYKIFNDNKDLVAEKVSDDTVLIFADRLVEIFKKRYKGKFDYSNIWIRSIKDETEPDEVENAIALVLRDILKIKLNKINITPIISKLTSDKYFDYPFFKRLIIFLIAENFEELKDIFKAFLEKEGSLYFNDITYEPELYYFLQKNADKVYEFSDTVIDILENKLPDKDIKINDKTQKEKIIANERLKWYLLLKNNDIFKKYYDKYFKIVGKEPKPYFTTPRTFIGTGLSPFTKEEILSMDDGSLIKYIKDFKPEGGSFSDENPTARGFSEMLRASSKERPEKFIKNLKEYTELPFFYFADILWGIMEALSENKINIENVNNFINVISEYLKTDKFWNDDYYLKSNNFDIHHVDHLSIISIIFVIFDRIAEQASIKNDITIISSLWDINIKVIDKIVERKEIKKYDDKDDLYLTNSTLANIIRVLIRLLDLHKINNKSNIIIKNFDDTFHKLLNNNCKEAIFWFGADFPFLYSIDREWSKKIIVDIRNYNEKWEVFMLGYSWNNNFDYDSYIFLKEDYEKALKYNFKKDGGKIKTILIQKICFSYLYKREGLNGNYNLFDELLKEWNYKYIEEIIDFFWRVKDKENKEISERIIDFWRWAYQKKYKNNRKLNDNDKKILSELSKLTVFLYEINNENYEWLKKSARFVGDFNSSFFIEYLDKLKEKNESYKYIPGIFKEILESTTPSYKYENIRNVIEFLYKKAKNLEDKGILNIINEIINIYNERGYEFLNEIYNKYNNN